jgi:FAD/FMN-containing dehydrogenase
VLPDGDVVTLAVPDGPPGGYDLLGAFVGSEGCFGVALDVTVKLTPNPESIRTLLADFLTIESAARTTSAIVAAGIVPAACELMDHGTIAAVEASIYTAGYPVDAAAVLLVEVDGAAASVDDEAGRVEAICRANGARAVRVASDPADRARLWQGRKKAFGAMGRVAPHLFVQDAVVPRTQLAEILAAIGTIGSKHGVRVCNVFHAGDGNLHPNIPYNGRDADEEARVHEAMREIMAMCIERGGTITGEHGVGVDKLPYMERLFTGDTLDAMCRLRSAFDPDRRANPGKVVPVHSCREWISSRQPAATTPLAGLAPSLSPAARDENPADREIADAILAARAAHTTVYSRGAGTHVPEAPADAVPLITHRRTGVIEYVPGDLTITVGSGMTLAELNAVTAEHGQWCPLLPWGTDECSVGGALATAARGPASAALGAPRDLALGLTFVDGVGSVVRAGGRVVKNVAGFDLTRTLIGSWGSLGAITSASLRLRARPVAQEAWAIPMDDASANEFQAFRRGPFSPVACEHVPASVASVLGLPDGDHVVVWLAASTVHVQASRSALRSCGTVRELPVDVWRAIRERGAPESPGTPALAMELRALNERLRSAFDPDGVFASPAMSHLGAVPAGRDG